MSDAPALVYLEADDEITAVVRRVRAADAGRVIVVAPGRSRATSSAVALRLLARAASEDNREVVVVGDALTRSLAAEAGLLAFASVDDARNAGTGDVPVEAPHHAAIHVVRGEATDETVVRPVAAATPAAPLLRAADETRPVRVPPARRPQPRPKPKARPARRRPSARLAGALVVAAALMVVAVMAGATLLPAATIAITPRLQSVSIDLDLTVDEPFSEGDTVRATAVVTATEPYDILESATGTVTFRNFNVVPIQVPAETLVATGDEPGDQAFATTEAVGVPPGQLTAEGTILAGEADAPIVAAAPGPAANVEAEAIDRVLSQTVAAQLRLFPQNNARLVINAEPMSGGVDDEGIQVSEADVAAAVEELRAELSRLVEEARPELGENLQVIEMPPAEAQIEVPEDLVGARDVPETEISGSQTWEVVAVDMAALEAEAADRLASDPAIPNGYELLPDSVQVDLGDPVMDGERVAAQATVSGSAAPRLDEDQVRSTVSGLSAAEAELALADLGDVHVALWPGWVASVPELDWRVDVRIEEPAP